MTEIKRLNYFTGQFLVEKDFQEEQKYHLEMRRRHNRYLHSWGIADGLQVDAGPGNKTITVRPGLAIDKDGQEIVLLDSLQVDLKDFGADAIAHVTARYVDTEWDKDDTDKADPTKYTRRTEKAKIEAKAAAPPTDGSVILLATVKLNGGNIGSPQSDGRRPAGSAAGADIAARSLTVSGPMKIDRNNTLEFGAKVSGKDVYAGKIGYKFAPGASDALDIVGVGTSNTDRKIKFFAEGGATFTGGLTVSKGLTVDGDATLKKSLAVTGNATLQTTAGKNTLDVQAAARTGTHPTGLALYVTANSDRAGKGVEFRTSDGSKGIGFGSDTIYMIGATQDLQLRTSAGRQVLVEKGLTVTGPVTLNGDLKLGDFSEADNNEIEKMIWLRNVDKKPTPTSLWDEKLVKQSSDRGHFKRAGFGIHMHQSREFGIWSTGPASLFSVEGGTGNAWVKGSLTVEGESLTVEGADKNRSLRISPTTDGANMLDVQTEKRTNLTLAAEPAVAAQPGVPVRPAEVARTAVHPTGLALYVTAPAEQGGKLVEFRHSNGSMGIGFGYTTIYATGDQANQPLVLKSRGAGGVKIVSDIADATQALSVTGGVEALRMLRGVIKGSGKEAKGAGFSVTKPDKGLYDIQFTPAFSDVPGASVTQLWNGKDGDRERDPLVEPPGQGGDLTDNAVIVYLAADRMRVKTGVYNGAADRYFSFIVIGPRGW